MVVTAIVVPSLLAAALPYYLLINFAFGTIHVIGSAMSPTIHDNDYLVAERIPYRLGPPHRGDIVIMRDPYDPSRDFIKRVIALPGERVLVGTCRVLIDGRPLTEPYVHGWSRCDPEWPSTGRERLLGSDEFFVMGDNRDHSADSRLFGPVERSQIEARARLRVLPLHALGPV